MTDQSIAIIVFAFNRPDKLERTLESLACCPEFEGQSLYLIIDGARHDDERSLVEATAVLADRISHPFKTVHRRDRNFGLKQSLREGITTVLRNHDAVIVLEDDLILGPNALNYLIRGLQRYRNEARVASICAYAMSEEEPLSAGDTSAYFLPMTHPWGWATWCDRWQAHLEGLAASEKSVPIHSKSFRMAMNVFGLRNWLQMLKLSEAGVVNSWWIYWHLDAVRNHQVSLFPARTHIINAGIDGSGTHASRWNILRGGLPTRTLAQQKEKLPDLITVDFAVLDRIVASREARLNRYIGMLGMILRHVRRMFAK